MQVSSSPVAAVPAAPAPRSAGADEAPKVRPVAEFKAIEPQAFADTPSHRAAARAPADLSIIPAETGSRLIYVFRDPESGQTIRQYPTQALVELGRSLGNLLDRQV